MNEGLEERWPEQHIHGVVDDLPAEFRAMVDEEDVRRAVEEAFRSFSGPGSGRSFRSWPDVRPGNYCGLEFGRPASSGTPSSREGSRSSVQATSCRN